MLFKFLTVIQALIESTLGNLTHSLYSRLIEPDINTLSHKHASPWGDSGAVGILLYIAVGNCQLFNLS